MLHYLSHSHSQALEFQINPLSQILLPTNSLHSHLHLSLLNICQLLQTPALNLHMHLQVSCHTIYLVSLVIDIKLNTFTFRFLMTSEHKFLRMDYYFYNFHCICLL